MSRSILRDGDERGEKIVSEFLDKHFYIECEDFHRVVDKVQQIKGVDTTNELKALRKNRLDSCVLISFFKKFLLF